MAFQLKNAAFSHWRYVLGVFIVIGIGVYFFFGRGTDLGATLTITSGDFKEQVRVSGTVIAAHDVDLGFATNGRIASVYARVGQYVTAGAILAETENGDLVASLAEAQSNLDALEAGTRPEEIAVASTAVMNAEATTVDAIQSAFTASDDVIHNKVDTFFTNSRTDPKLTFVTSNSNLKTIVEADRIQMEVLLADWATLVDTLSITNVGDSATVAQQHLARVAAFLVDINATINQGIPDSTVTSAILSSYATTLATARTNVNSAIAALTTAFATLDSAKKNLALKKAGSTSDALDAQRAIVASARAELAKTRVTAPFGGTVTRMEAKVGEIVSPTASLLSMQSDGIFQIETYIPEVTIVRVAVGNKATTTLDAYGLSAAFPSAVVAVDPAETVKDGVPTYKTTLTFLASDARIRSGMTTDVLIETGSISDAIVIPAGAVGTKNGESYVSVVERGATTERVVTIGRSPALGQVQVLSGLAEGDIILLTPTPATKR